MNEPTKTEEAFASLDTEKLQSKITQDVNKTVEEQVNQKMGEFADRITGKKPDSNLPWEQRGADKPADWGEAVGYAAEEGARMAEDRMIAREKEREEAQTTKDTEAKQAEESKTQDWYKGADADWNDLVAEGKMPAVNAEVSKKIREGVKQDEAFAKDEGLVERIKLLELSKKHNITPYKAYHKYYAKEHPGKKAPVFGASKAVPQGKERSYEDNHSVAMQYVR